MGHIYSRGVEAAIDAKGNLSRSRCKAVVVYQPEESDEPLPMMHAESEKDAQEYVRAMRESGHGKGLRIRKPSEVEE